jgi:transcriptional antiterminator RfaH
MAYWCCARTELRSENKARHFLELNGYSSYVPLVRSQRIRRGRRSEKIEPLFPSYIFISIQDGRWWTARWCVGVLAVIMSGDQPAHVPDRVLDEIRRREVHGAVELPEAPGLRAGDRVRVTRGPLVGLGGLYAGQAPHERVAVLLTLLGGQTRVVLPRGDIEGDWLGSPGDGQPSLLVRHQSSARSQLGLLPNRHPPDARSRAGAAKTTRCGTPT